MSWGRSNFLPSNYTPNSTVVQSDDEWNRDWSRRFGQTAQMINQPGWTPDWQVGLSAMNAGPNASSTDLAGQLAIQKEANKYGLAWHQDTGGGNGYLSEIAGGIPQVSNPAYDALQVEYQKAGEERAADQKRQTQAYGQMQGGNYFGGMIDGRYSEAFNGQMAQGSQTNGDPTSSSAWGAPGQSTFGETFGSKPKQYRAGGWGSYGW